jgi:branched-chain amino acid transport system ATP-binding protein
VTARRRLAAVPVLLLLGPHLATLVAVALALVDRTADTAQTGMAEARRTVAASTSARVALRSIPLLAAAGFGFDAIAGSLTVDGRSLGGGRWLVEATGVLAVLVAARSRPRHVGSSGATLVAALLGAAVAVVLVAASPVVAVASLASSAAGAARAVAVVALAGFVTAVVAPRVRSVALLTAAAWTLPGLLGVPIARSIADDAPGAALVTIAATLAAAAAVVTRARRTADADVASASASPQPPPDAGTALLTVRGIEAGYDGLQVLFGVDIDVEPGEIVALLGTNGAGKSTLLSSVSGLLDPTAGSVWFDGRDITHVDARTTARLGLVQMPGGRSVFPTMTVAEHYKLASWLVSDAAHVSRATEETLGLFPQLADRWDELAGNMSGGEQQMLGLSMALVARPKLLMIDELSLGLAPAVVETLIDVVRRIQAGGTAVVLVEQSVNVALTIADRAYFLEKGEVRFSGPTAELLERDDILRAVFLTERSTRTGRRRRAAPVQVAPRPVLEVDGIVKRFGGIVAVDGVSFTLGRGEILGLIGPNGAGKTTVFDVLSGFLDTDEGRVVLDGVDITRWSPDRRARAGLGRSFQDARLVPSCTVAENLALGLERHLVHRDHLAHALSLPHVRVQEANVAWTVDDLVELLGLGAFRHKLASELSTGSRRIVDLAMCIGHHPTVLILDEPSSGIAQREAEALAPLLRNIQDETGCSMLLIEHDMQLIADLSHRMLALEVGRVIAEGTPAEVMADPRVVSSYLGTNDAAINRSSVQRGSGRR